MIPVTPDGATVDSMLLATSRLDGSTSHAGAWHKYYASNFRKANPFGRRAGVLSTNAFAGDLSPEEIVLRHSAWPVYSSLVSRRTAQAWFRRTRDGTERHAVPEIHSPVRGELFASRWRSCSACTKLQQHKYGTGHWMVVHQLPGVGYCPTHGEPLELECGACGAALGGGGQSRLPGEPCFRCGESAAKTTKERRTSGEEQLACLYTALLGGQATDLDAMSRRMILQEASDALECSAVPSYLAERVLFAFDCDTPEGLGRYLNVAVSPRTFKLALAGESTNAVPAPLHLAVIAVAMAELSDQGRSLPDGPNYLDSLPKGLALHKPDLLPETWSELLALAADHNVPQAALAASLAGESPLSIEARSFASQFRLDRFIRSLPARLACHFPKRRRPNQSQLILRGASHDERRTAHRARIVQMIEAGARNRTLLLAKCSESYKWVLKFDRPWLDALLPAWRRKTSE